MADEANPQAPVLSPPTEPELARPEAADTPEVKESAGTNGTISREPTEPKEVAMDAPIAVSEPENTNDKQPKSDETAQDKPATTREDINMQHDLKPEDVVPAADESADPTADTPASGGKSKVPRRKSGGVPEHKKKLNKKASKAKMTHTDAKPGDYFYVRLKGYPLWPAIVCDESMLPTTLIKSRPVTAARPDGSYRDDYEDGGSKVKDRTFPVMYLHTNEFGWIPNYDLLDLDFDTVGDVQPKMRKDLAAAHTLAAEQHDLDYFKEVLKNFMEAREADRLAKEAAKAEKAEKAAEKAAAKKVSRKPSKAVLVEEDEDVEMPDAPADLDSGDATPATTKKPKTKKRDRPVDEESTPSDSSKKVKLNFKVNTPKTTNGTSTPKSTKDSSSTKSSKPKTKKAAPKAADTPEAVVPKEPELTAEEKRAKKEKEILFLRHKLQKGLLTRDQIPKEDEMKQMSEFVSKLEGYAELEVSIIRATKINKVLKAILKLPTIPREEEFQFKPRSQTLLDKWNKLLASEQGTPSAPPTTTNGASETKAEGDEAKGSPVESTNGVQETATQGKTQEKAVENMEKVEESAEDKAEEKVKEKAPVTEPSVPVVAEAKDTLPVVESTSAPSVEESSKESIPEPTPVEPTA